MKRKNVKQTPKIPASKLSKAVLIRILRENPEELRVAWLAMLHKAQQGDIVCMQIICDTIGS